MDLLPNHSDLITYWGNDLTVVYPYSISTVSGQLPVTMEIYDRYGRIVPDLARPETEIVGEATHFTFPGDVTRKYTPGQLYTVEIKVDTVVVRSYHWYLSKDARYDDIREYVVTEPDAYPNNVEAGVGVGLGQIIAQYEDAKNLIDGYQQTLSDLLDQIAQNGGSTGSGFVPYYIEPGKTYIVPRYQQALSLLPIRADGIIKVDGLLRIGQGAGNGSGTSYEFTYVPPGTNYIISQTVTAYTPGVTVDGILTVNGILIEQ